MKFIGFLALGAVLARTQEYNETLSRQLVFYSAATFCEQSTLVNWTCGKACDATNGSPTVTFVSNIINETFGVVVYNSEWDTITCAFRGSHNKPNWDLDFESWFVPYKSGPGKVHYGF
jgi:hypothetical protein